MLLRCLGLFTARNGSAENSVRYWSFFTAGFTDIRLVVNTNEIQFKAVYQYFADVQEGAEDSAWRVLVSGRDLEHYSSPLWMFLIRKRESQSWKGSDSHQASMTRPTCQDLGATVGHTNKPEIAGPSGGA